MSGSPDTKWSGSLPSEESCTKPCPQKNCGSIAYSPDTKHNEPWLWLDLRQYLVPPPYMTPPLNVLITLYYVLSCAPFRLITMHDTITSSFCHPVPLFLPIVAYKCRAFLNFVPLMKIFGLKHLELNYYDLLWSAPTSAYLSYIHTSLSLSRFVRTYVG